MEKEKKATRQSYGEALLEVGKENADVVVLDADLSSATKTNIFAKELPERFFDIGIAEANMMGTAAGLAEKFLMQAHLQFLQLGELMIK